MWLSGCLTPILSILSIRLKGRQEGPQIAWLKLVSERARRILVLRSFEDDQTLQAQVKIEEEAEMTLVI